MVPTYSTQGFTTRFLVVVTLIATATLGSVSSTAGEREIDLSALEARAAELRTRLALTDEQSEQIKPVLIEYLENTSVVLQGFGINIETGERPDMFGREFAAVQQRSISTGERIDRALSTQAQLTTTFPASGLGSSLSMVAKMIQARAALGLNRQVFFVAAGAWDTHGSQLQNHPQLLAELSQGLAAFYQATEELGLESNVTTFTASAFGRTLTSNGDGSAHGWGGNQLLMGGSVRGGDAYGSYPEVTINGDNDAGRGRIIPTTAVDQLAATLAHWYGNFCAGELVDLLPQLPNFGQADLAFMA